MSLMHETVLRYEGPPRRNKDLCRAEQKQRAANENYRELMEYTRVLNEEERAMERTRRNEACEMKMNQRKMDSTLNQCKAEAKQFAKACIMVRRRALEVQLQREMAQYGAELAGVGHAFHNERL